MPLQLLLEMLWQIKQLGILLFKQLMPLEISLE